MRITTSRISVCLSTAALLGLLAAPALANTVPIPANPPSSSCVTATTKSMYAGVQAQYAKDIAPYASNAAAKNAIANYQMVLDEAWSAMTLPYCGYGQYGNASATHSYQKTTSRARTTFLAAIATVKKGGTVAAASVPTPTSVAADVTSNEPAPAPTPAPKPVVKAPPKIVVASSFNFRGMHLGQRGDDVTALQKMLVAHYKLSSAGHVTGYFGSVTNALLIKFQLEKKIITSSNDDAAGIIGPKTSVALNALQ